MDAPAILVDHGPLIHAAELMQSLFEVFSLYAELALGLAGFTGVAASFAGRDRMFRPTELTRLQGILLNSASVLAGCVAFFSTATFQLSEQSSQSAVGISSFLVTAPLLAFVIPDGWRHHRDPDSTTETWALVFVTTVTVGLLSAYSFAASPWGNLKIVVAAFSVQLLFGLWLFVRLLTRPN